MDNRLVLAVLFVTLSWMSAGTFAQTNSTTAMPANATGSNMTTAMMGSNMTTAMMGSNMTTAMMGGNMTTAMTGGNMTTAMMGGNMTTAMMGGNMTTAMMGGNMTTAMMGGNMTTAMMGSNMTTAPASGSNVTTAPASGSNMTTAPASGSNVTTAPASGSNVTTAPASGSNVTTAPASGSNVTTAATTPSPLLPNTTVTTLTANISRQECGSQLLCAAEPSSCDPSTGASCFFLGAKSRGGRNFDFELSGESDGYLAATLSPDATVGNGDDTYVCANNNGVVQFFSRVFENGVLRDKTLPVNSVKGKVNGRKIQCTFSATVPEPITRTTNLALSISNGTFSSSGELGAPEVRLRSPVVDLGSPQTTVNNELSSTTAPPTTTGHAAALQQSLTQALLVLAGLLGLAML